MSPIATTKNNTNKKTKKKKKICPEDQFTLK